MTTKPDESTSRKVILANLVPILLSPLSLVLGFYLGHALQKPRLSIVDLDQSYYLKDHSISAGLRKQMADQPLLVTTLRGELMRTALEKHEDACTPWLDGEDWQDRCTDPVLLGARSLLSSLIAQPDTPLPELLRSMRFSQAQRESLGKTLNQLIAELETIRSDERKERTGEMNFVVGILNTGDFDGVVSKFGQLSFDGGSFGIDAEAYTVVKAHGFETITFAARDATAAEQQVFDKWREIVKTRPSRPEAHSEDSFRIELKSGEGKPMRYEATLFK